MKTNPKSSPRDVVLTTAFGISFSRAVPFFHSLAGTGFRGRIIVFTANLPHHDLANYTAAGAEVHDHGVHLHRLLRHPLQALFWRRVREWPESGSFTPPWDRLQQANILRWSLYQRFLEATTSAFDRVLMVDLRDVVFQADPFQQACDERLRVFAEEDDLRVGDSAWNTLAARRAFGAEHSLPDRNYRVFCSGVVLGAASTARHYLQHFTRERRILELPDHGTDQAIHTRLVHRNVVEFQKLGNREGEAIHLHSVGDLSKIECDAEGRLLNADGRPFSILHQYDRHPALARTLAERFCHSPIQSSSSKSCSPDRFLNQEASP